MKLRILVLALGFTAFGLHSRATQVIESDICVYGGTSGGVSAAVAAARLGKTVVLLSLNNHVGGMTASGLGVTDISLNPPNEPSYIGGIAKEFYQRVGKAYGSGSPGYYFEPHVAEDIFWQMLAEAGVPVFTNKLLASVTITNSRIGQIITEDGSLFRAKQFIDTTYEGDLMAAAGVTFTWGREATTNYNESLAGIRTFGGSYNYDPYVIPGNPASGLLALVQTNTGGNVGDADKRLQAYNFRLCLTQNVTNKIVITAPTNYAEANYELVRRYLDARVAKDGSVSLGQLIHIQTIIPNGKTDINANGELSTDYVGYNYTWATNTYAGREQLRAAHEDYIRGLLYFYATSTNVPANVRTEAQTWGLAKDEFKDTGGWPWQIYVREARRMVSDYVMIQQNGEYKRVAPDPIALARYDFDSHGVRRLESGGYSRWEGGLGGSPPFPYGISYHSIVARTGECENVYCTFALSASHAAFASCRMEPVFMMTSQSAGTAAAFAVDDNVPGQALDYQRLAAGLRATGQILDWPAASQQTNGFIVDNLDANATLTGAWTAGANSGAWSSNYIHDGNAQKGSKSAKFTPNLPTSGTYEVYAWWVAASASFRDAHVPIDIVHPAGTNRVLVNQQANGSKWNLLLVTNFNAGTAGTVTVRNDGTTNYVVADAIRFVAVGSAVTPPPPPTVEIVALDPDAIDFGTNHARLAIVRRNDTNLLALTVNFTVGGTAVSGVDYAALSASVTLTAGAVATNLDIVPVINNTPDGDRTVTLTLQPSVNYVLTALSNATAVIHDRPFDQWRRAEFTVSELADPQLSGDLADFDHDGLANLMEYALGLTPKTADASALSPRVESDHFMIRYTRNKAATDILLTLEVSPDLVSWSSNPSAFEQLSCVDEGEVQRITVRLATLASSGGASYVRLRVTKL